MVFSNHMSNLTATLSSDAVDADRKTLTFSFHMPETHQERRFVFKLEPAVCEQAASIVTSVNKKYL